MKRVDWPQRGLSAPGAGTDPSALSFRGLIGSGFADSQRFNLIRFLKVFKHMSLL